MKPLITIETVPISIEYTEKKPEKSVNEARMQITTHGLSKIRNNPIRIKMDTFEFSGKPPDNYTFTYKATAQYSSDGNLKLNVQMDSSEYSEFSEYHYTQFYRCIENIIESINFDMRSLPCGLPAIDNLNTGFLPPDIEIKVVERPKVIIKYVGGPLYIPKSADPDYVPPRDLEEKSGYKES